MTPAAMRPGPGRNAGGGPGFRWPRLLLPRPGIDLAKWAVIACDQHTAEPAYWQRVAGIVGDAPSTLNLIFPEVHLGDADAKERIAAIRRAMRRTLDEGVLVPHEGAVLVERTVDGRTRRGLMLELDLEHYDCTASSTSLVRPTEGTIVARLAPRVEVRREALLELPHILVLIDDPGCTVIEPVAAAVAARRAAVPRAGGARGAPSAKAPLYDSELMLGGGHVAGHAVDDALARQAAAALAALAAPAAVARRCGVGEDTPPMLFAVGDGNHSLATAKAIWEQSKATVGPDCPSRWALVEVENIHDPALHFAPIHRLLVGVKGGAAGSVRKALARHFGARLRLVEQPSAEAMRAAVDGETSSSSAATSAPATSGAHAPQVIGLIEPGPHFASLHIADPQAPLAVATAQSFADAFVAAEGAFDVDYVHGDETLARLAQQPAHAGLHIGTVAKGELFKRVLQYGPLPRKTFSMGEAHEKRYYVEARRIR